MRQYLFLILLSWLFAACEDDSIDTIFESTPESRVAVKLDSMQQMLVDAPYGWVASLKYNNMMNEQVYYLSFKKDGCVEMRTGAGTTMVEGGAKYSLKYSQQVDLVFDTYSLFADLVKYGGDFRFTLNSQQGELTEWHTRSDGNVDQGVLVMKPIRYESYYDELMSMRSRVMSDINRAFYRVLTVDGADRKYAVTCQSAMVLEWMEGDKMQTMVKVIDVDTAGFNLLEPLEVAGKKIDRFVCDVNGYDFDAYSGQKKVGRLAYTHEKPFVRPGLVERFMNKVGATTSSLRIYPDGYSKMVSDSLDVLRSVRDDFVWMHLQPYNNQAIYACTKGTAYYRIETTYGEDEITMTWVGTAKDPFSKLLQDLVRPSMHMFTGTFSLVYRNDTFYFVRNDDSRISWIGIPRSLPGF